MNYYADDKIDELILKNYFPENFKGIMLETGASHPTVCSMSRAFREKNWRTICVEPNQYYVDLHKKEGNEIYEYALSDKILPNQDFEIVKLQNDFYYKNTEFEKGIAYSAISVRHFLNEPHIKEIVKVNIVTLNWLLDFLQITKLNYISIDVEGWELEVMKGFNTHVYNPEVIVLENYTHNESYNIYMNSINYTLDKKINYNYIYIHE
jgi:FkbM family methyltransferase